MYKKQMILQRVVCYLCLAAAALVFIYSLGLVTDMYDSNFSYYAESFYLGYGDAMFPGTEVYYLIQDFNQDLTMVGVGLILIAAAQMLFRNDVRRKYYIANYITVGVYTIASIVATVWALGKIFDYKELYLTIDFEPIRSYAELMQFNVIESTFWFDISVFVFGVLIVAAIVNVVNLIFKIVLMKAEKELIEAGKGV